MMWVAGLEQFFSLRHLRMQFETDRVVEAEEDVYRVTERNFCCS